MKRHTCLSRLLPLALAAALLTVPAAAFRDTSGHWAEQTLNAWQAQGFLDGYGDGTCQPDGPVTRAGFAKLMNRAMGFTAEAPITFTDVGEDDWFHTEVARAVAAGYAQGSGGMFLPRQNITRAQAAAMLARAAGLTADEAKADGFTDAASLPAWAKGSIGAAADAGLMSGYADGTFRADGLITRAQAVVTLDRLMKHTQDTAKDPAGTTGGTKTPSTSGGSSGGGSSAAWTVTGAEAVPDVTVDYGAGEAEAMGKFPGAVTLNAVKRGQTGTVSAQVSWALDKPYDASPLADTVYTATGTVTLPSGCTYSGALTVTAKLTVKGEPDKRVVSISEAAGLELPFGSQRGDARLPTNVTVETETGGTLLADVTWTLDGAWASPGVNKFTGTVAMPAGYYYNGKTTAAISTTVTVAEDNVTPGKKLVVDHLPLPTTIIGYASTEELVLAAAGAKLPTELTLQCQDGSYIAVTVPANDWKFTYTPYAPSSGAEQTVSLTMDAALPEGYDNHDGKMTVYCSVEIKKLDTAALEGALDEAKAQLAALTDSEDAALADPAKLYVAPNGTSAENVTNGVRFIYADQKTALNDAYTAARSKQNSGTFASQAECDRLARELQEASAALKAAVQTGTNVNAWAYVKSLVEDALSADRNPDAPYHSVKQPLKAGSFYPLFHFTGMSLPGSDMVLSSISWSAKGDGANLVDIGRGVGSNPDAYGAKINSAPTEPQSVTFAATAVCTHKADPNKTFPFTFEYTATIGAPIRVDTAAAAAEPPRLTSGNKKNNISVQVPLMGAEYITGVDTSRITAAENTAPTGEVPLATRAVSITVGKSCTVDSSYGLSVPVTASCGYMGATLAPAAPDADPAHIVGRIPVTIQSGALTVDESGGWYAPDNDLTYAAKVWGCNPTVTVLTQPAEGSHYTVSVNMAYMFEIRAIEVVYKTSDGIPSGAGDGVHVIFSRDDGKPDASVQDGIAYKEKTVELTPGAYHIWVTVENDGMWLQGDTLTVNDNSSSADSTP